MEEERDEVGEFGGDPADVGGDKAMLALSQFMHAQQLQALLNRHVVIVANQSRKLNISS